MIRLPPHAPGMSIGLYGGSFDPAHQGHRHVSLLALRRLGLDRLWWLVSPGNPLKDVSGLPPLAERMARARIVARHPRIDVSDVEAQLGFRFSREVIAWLVRRRPDVSFVWIMGADNLASFHRWERWREIASLVPIAVVDRPGATHATLGSRFATAFGRDRLDEADARRLARSAPPAWCLLHGPRSALSSTALRAAEAPPRA